VRQAARHLANNAGPIDTLALELTASWAFARFQDLGSYAWLRACRTGRQRLEVPPCLLSSVVTQDNLTRIVS
jgi:hypothetical protein